jgi:hypothetical protein
MRPGISFYPSHQPGRSGKREKERAHFGDLDFLATKGSQGDIWSKELLHVRSMNVCDLLTCNFENHRVVVEGCKKG